MKCPHTIALMLILQALPFSLAHAQGCDPAAPDYTACLKREADLASNHQFHLNIKAGAGSLRVNEQRSSATLLGAGAEGIWINRKGHLAQGKLASDVAFTTTRMGGNTSEISGELQSGMGTFYKTPVKNDRLKGPYVMLRLDAAGLRKVAKNFDEPSISHSLVSIEQGYGFIDLKRNISLLLGVQGGLSYETLSDPIGTYKTSNAQAGVNLRAQFSKFSATGQMHSSVGAGAVNVSAAVSGRLQANRWLAVEGSVSRDRVAAALASKLVVTQQMLKVSVNPWAVKAAK